MSRILETVMQARIDMLQEIMENNPEGMSINELVTILKEQGIKLPKSEYQAIHIILRDAEKKGDAVKTGSKWTLAIEDEELINGGTTEQES